jgi:hypothetical protein
VYLHITPPHLQTIPKKTGDAGLARPCYFLDKALHAQLAGADALLVVNDGPGDLSTAVAPDDEDSSRCAVCGVWVVLALRGTITFIMFASVFFARSLHYNLALPKPKTGSCRR